MTHSHQTQQSSNRYDSGNERLEADLSEVRAAAASQQSGSFPPAPNRDSSSSATDAAPADPAAAAEKAIRSRGEARFKARDFEGAAEAFGALLALLQRRGEWRAHNEESGSSVAPAEAPAAEEATAAAQQSRALANRAACWLPLERYEDCLSDCRAALRLLLPPAMPGGDAAEMAGAEPGAACSANLAVAEAAVEQAASLGDLAAADEREGRAGAAARLAAARLVARMALACACLKRGEEAARLYACARRLFGALGDGEQVERLRADEEKLVGAAPAAADKPAGGGWLT